MKTSVFRILIIVISLILGQPAYAENSKIIGTFSGIIWSTYELPGITEFYLTDSKEIEAKYIYKDGDADAEGLLSNCGLSALILSCIWSDDHGTGDFLVEFKSDFSSFSGKWFDETSSEKRNLLDSAGFDWNGKRQK